MSSRESLLKRCIEPNARWIACVMLSGTSYVQQSPSQCTSRCFLQQQWLTSGWSKLMNCHPQPLGLQLHPPRLPLQLPLQMLVPSRQLSGADRHTTWHFQAWAPEAACPLPPQTQQHSSGTSTPLLHAEALSHVRLTTYLQDENPTMLCRPGAAQHQPQPAQSPRQQQQQQQQRAQQAQPHAPYLPHRVAAPGLGQQAQKPRLAPAPQRLLPAEEMDAEAFITALQAVKPPISKIVHCTGVQPQVCSLQLHAYCDGRESERGAAHFACW